MKLSGKKSLAMAAARVEILETRRLMAADKDLLPPLPPAAVTVSGTLFDDRNASGTYDSGDWISSGSGTVYLDLNRNGALDTDEPSAVTENGAFSIRTDARGDQALGVIFDAPFTASTPTTVDVTIPDRSTALGPVFGAWRPGSVSGTLYLDANNSGTYDAGDQPSLAGTVYADLNNNAALDAGEPSSRPTVASQFNWQLPGLKPGVYTIRTQWDTTSAYIPTGAQAQPVTVTGGMVSMGMRFGATMKVRVTGNVFSDVNRNGTRDAGDSSLLDRRVYVDLNNNGVYDAAEPSTQTLPSTSINNFGLDLLPGTYTIRQSLPAGWRQTTPAADAGVTMNLTAGYGYLPIAFGSTADVVVALPVWNDANGNGTRDAGEAAAGAGHRVYLDVNKDGLYGTGDVAQTTDAKGFVNFTLPYGTAATFRLIPLTGYQATNYPGAYNLTISGS